MPTFQDKSSCTADMVARLRLYTDIPYAREIAKLAPAMPREDEEQLKNMLGRAPIMEARYRMTNEKIERYGARHVVELAAGFSPRGLEITSDPERIVVEVDLPDQIARKKMIVKHLVELSIIAPRPNLKFVEGDVCDPDVYRLIAQELDITDAQSVAVVCEGLLRYLAMKDKRLLARNIHGFLHVYNGMWITPDSETLEERATLPGFRERHEFLQRRTGLDALDNVFRDRAALLEFFEYERFSVQETPLVSMIDKLVSPVKLNLKREEYEPDLRARSTLVALAR